MIYQSKEYSCGPAAIVNALKCYGVNKAERTVARLCSTTAKEGTNEHGMRQGIGLLGYSALTVDTDDESLARQWLVDSLTLGYPALLCVSNWSHWVCAGALCYERVFVFDSDVNCRNVQNNGVHCLTTNQVLHWWRADKKVKSTYEHSYYGLSVVRDGKDEAAK